jgi:hypothetical protein
MRLNKLMLLFAILMFMFQANTSEAQITSNVYTRVLKVQVGDYTGSAFTMDVDGRQYILTAKHLVASLKDNDSVNVFKGDQWLSIPVKVLKCDDPIDIAVLVPDKPLTLNFELSASPADHQVTYGQEVYFVGFPFGLHMDSADLNQGYPLAFVKKGVLSAIAKENGALVILLDGFNNHGFSGGPMVYRDVKNPNGNFYVLGVISGFRPELSSVMRPEKLKPGEDTSKLEQWRLIKKDGQTAILKDTEQMVALNTGIVIGYGIKHAIDLIQSHPIGPKVQ